LLGKDEWHTDHGRVILGAEASQRLTKLIGKDPLDLAANLVEHFKNQGITDPMEQMRLTLRALGRQTTQRYTAEEVANFHQMIAERDRMKQGFGAGDSFNTFMNKDVSANLLALSNAWNNLLTAVAGPNSENVIAILHKLTGAINYMTQQVNQTDPQTITKIAEAIGVLGVAMTGAGAVAILAALGPAGWVAGIAIGLAATAAAFPKVREALVAIPTALNDAIDFVVKALGTVASRIAEAINKLGHSILGSAEGIAKGGAGGAGGNYDQMGNPTGAPMRFVPGTDGKLKAQPISMSLNVDGRTLAQAISEQLEYLYEHQTGASAADGSRGYPGNAPFTAA
jgi:hypothetical protein